MWPQSNALVMAETSSGGAEVKRYTRDELEAFVSSKPKTFCKQRCAECGEYATKRFSGTSSFVVKSMLDTCWCSECGRLLCESHRHQHTCERIDQQKEKNRTLTHEQLRAQMEEAEALKAAMEEQQKSAQRAEAEAAEAQRQQRKEKRKILASKAKRVEDFLQAMSRDTEMNLRPQRLDELLELYTRAKRISLTLYNEFEHPSHQGLAQDDWDDVKAIYQRAVEITGRFAAVDGEPLDMRNYWDPPPAPQPQQ